MSDLSMRRAEHSDSVTTLICRLCLGQIAPERVAYAAALSNPVALALIEPAELPADPRERSAYAARPLSHIEAVRWAADLAELAIKHAWDTNYDQRPAEAIAATRRWAGCPCEHHRAAVVMARASVMDLSSTSWPSLSVTSWAAVYATALTAVWAADAAAWAAVWATKGAGWVAQAAVRSGAITWDGIYIDLADRLVA